MLSLLYLPDIILPYILLTDITVLDTIYDHNIKSIYIVIYSKRIKAKSTKWQKRPGIKISECTGNKYIYNLDKVLFIAYQIFIIYNLIVVLTFPESVSRTYTTGKPSLGIRNQTFPLKILTNNT